MNNLLYKLTFPNGKIYLGMTYKTAEERFKDHTYFAITNKYDYMLHRAIRKYGPDSVKIETLAVGSREYIMELEVRAIALFKTQDTNIGYNIHKGGPGTAFYGPHTEEAKAKIAKASTGRKHTSQAKRKMTTHLFEYAGEIKSIRELSDKYGIPAGTLNNRILKYKWSVERAITQPWSGRSIMQPNKRPTT